MARKIIEEITDDIDGSSDAETIQFSYGGTDYEIDLGKRNQDKLDNALAPFIDAARRVGRSTGSRKASAASGGPKRDLDAIREWARKNGHEVSTRGRVANHIVEAYDAAN